MAIDVSILGYSAEDITGMSAEERADAMREVLNRAADLLIAASHAFAVELGETSRYEVRSAAEDVIKVVRGI